MLLVLTACVLLVAACGSAAAPSGSGTAGHPRVSAAQPPTSSACPTCHGVNPGGPRIGATQAAGAKVSLDVTIYPSGAVPPAHYVLRCDPDGGTVPDPAAACAQLLSGQDLFAPQPRNVVCPMILASGARAVIDGTYLGLPVAETITDGGCDLARWAKVTEIFPLPTS